MAKQFQVDTGGTLTTSLVAYWKLEDLTEYYVGDGTKDVTNNGTPNVSFTTGKVNNGASGGNPNTTAYLKCPVDLGVWTGQQAISIAFWFKNIAEIGSGEWDYLWAGKNAASNVQFFRGWYSYNGGTRQLAFYRHGSTDNAITSNQTLGTGWHLYVGTYDGTNLRLYLDNTLVAGPTASSGTGAGDTNAMSMLADRTGGSYCSSIVDEWGLWSKALSTTEIGDLWNGGAGQTMVIPTTDMLGVIII